jgi:hypothetical protein
MNWVCLKRLTYGLTTAANDILVPSFPRGSRENSLTSDTRHYYSMEEDGEYGYERGISENDEKAGQKATALIMVRYMAEKEGAHTIRTADGSFSYFSSCKPPCDFVKERALGRAREDRDDARGGRRLDHMGHLQRTFPAGTRFPS